jgi:hypothetical protein
MCCLNPSAESDLNQAEVMSFAAVAAAAPATIAPGPVKNGPLAKHPEASLAHYTDASQIEPYKYYICCTCGAERLSVVVSNEYFQFHR